MNNDTSAPKKPLSKRDKFLAYGCLLPLMAFAAVAFLSDLTKGEGDAGADKIEARGANGIDDNSPKPFTVKEAAYLLETTAKLWLEAENANASPVDEGESPEFDLIKNARLKTEGLLYDLKNIYGYEHRLNSIGTFRGNLADALLSLHQALTCISEMRSAKTGDALSAAARLRRISLENCSASLREAEDVLNGAKFTHSDNQL